MLLNDADRDDLAAELAQIIAELAEPPPPPGRLVPEHVERYRRAAGISSLDRIRWCDWCGIVAPAIDHHQISFLDSVGFDTLCPDCKCPAGP